MVVWPPVYFVETNPTHPITSNRTALGNQFSTTTAYAAATTTIATVVSTTTTTISNKV